jgi:hypothetical protein
VPCDRLGPNLRMLRRVAGATTSCRSSWFSRAKLHARVRNGDSGYFYTIDLMESRRAHCVYFGSLIHSFTPNRKFECNRPQSSPPTS